MSRRGEFGVVASKKLKAAILAQQTAGGRMNFTRKHDSDWVDDVDTLIRVACQMYREVKKDSTKYVRCVRKASVQEKERLDFVLGCLQLDDQAPVVAMDQQETEPEPELRTVAPGSVFSKVLAKKPSAPDSPEKATVAVVSTTFTSSSSGSKEASVGRPTLRRQMAFLELDKKEGEEMMKWMCSSSCVSKAPKRLKRPAAQKKAESKGKKKVQKDKKAVVKKRTFVQKVLKCSFRKRVCDAAYHKAKKAALAEGQAPEEACEAGKEASRKVRRLTKVSLWKNEKAMPESSVRLL